MASGVATEPGHHLDQRHGPTYGVDLIALQLQDKTSAAFAHSSWQHQLF